MGLYGITRPAEYQTGSDARSARQYRKTTDMIILDLITTDYNPWPTIKHRFCAWILC